MSLEEGRRGEGEGEGKGRAGTSLLSMIQYSRDLMLCWQTGEFEGRRKEMGKNSNVSKVVSPLDQSLAHFG